jgi:hypothetical protein
LPGAASEATTDASDTVDRPHRMEAFRRRRQLGDDVDGLV